MEVLFIALLLFLSGVHFVTGVLTGKLQARLIAVMLMLSAILLRESVAVVLARRPSPKYAELGDYWQTFTQGEGAIMHYAFYSLLVIIGIMILLVAMCNRGFGEQWMVKDD